MRGVFSCRDSARLASEAQHSRLSWARRIALRLHLMMCAGCRAYSRQIQGLASLMRRRARENEGALGSQDGLRPDERTRIREALDEAANGGAPAE